MIRLWLFLSIFISGMFGYSCKQTTKAQDITIGAVRTDNYLTLLEDKNIGLLVNHTSMVEGQHLLDFLLVKGIKVTRIFAPEHGFRGTADAGEQVGNTTDEKTGIPVTSLYGTAKKPNKEMLEGLDVVVFDIQDVGVRFYTYISSMHYMMEICAEQDIEMMVFDRPNPNGYYVDGPVRKPEYQSFVGMHPIPIVHGMTVGELARMINEENWLSGGVKCKLMVIEMQNYDHNQRYSLPVKPSPNLPNDRAINLYPSLCLFEGTMMSVGRGTQFPFQVLGYPDPAFGDFTFTPVSIEGMAKNPKLKDQQCFGIDLRKGDELNRITLEYLIYYYNLSSDKEEFFNSFFEKLAGTDELRKQIVAGMSESEIRASWQDELNKFKTLRVQYLLYPDFQ